MRWRLVGGFALVLGTFALGVFRGEAPPTPAKPVAPAASSAPLESPEAREPEEREELAARPLALPRGGLVRLSCRESRRVVAHIKSKLAVPASSPSAAELARTSAGWFDPHGLWSAAPDSPIRAAMLRHAAALLSEVEAPATSASECAAALEVGRITRDWVAEMRLELERGGQGAARVSRERARALAEESVFEDDPVRRPARSLARDLGQRLQAFESHFGDAGGAVSAARSRLLPEASVEAWSEALLAALVRAYVPLIDPHGQWAPLEEEWSLYTADPALDAEPRLWGRMVRTTLGVRVEDDPAAPVQSGDLVLDVGGVATAGLSVEQIEQLSHLESIGGENARVVVVLEPGTFDPKRLSVDLARDTAPEGDALTSRRVQYGDGEALVVVVPDVPDELGDELEALIASASDGGHPPIGVVLDLRGNGGGSIDGAAAALGVFLPGAPLFPLRRRDGTVEIQEATAPSAERTWTGPVAALVDGYTASAAEMIAGALVAYRRGPAVGSRTFGKGCIQEYFDDPSGSGVLRLTTMLFALPDGAPLQGIGLSPTLSLTMPLASERERSIAGSLRPWQGPDVRRRDVAAGPDWPPHRGRFGDNDDPALRSALSRLGSAPPAGRFAAKVAGRPTRRSSAK